MNNTRASMRRSWPYLLILWTAGIYAMMPAACGGPFSIILQDATELLQWIETLKEQQQ